MTDAQATDALYRWASDVQSATSRVGVLLGQMPMPDEDDDLELFLDPARLWHANVVDGVEECRSLMASPPPGDHDVGLMRALHAGMAGVETILGYGVELAGLMLDIIRDLEAGDYLRAEALLEKVLDYPVVMTDAFAKTLSATAAAASPEDAIGRLIAANGIAHAIAVHILRARNAAETGAHFEVEGMRDEISKLVANYAGTIAAADLQMKELSLSLLREPEIHAAPLAILMPSYLEDVADFLLLEQVFAGLPAIADNAGTVEDFVALTETTYHAFQTTTRANGQRTSQRAALVRGSAGSAQDA
jgi:hypothetical protein